MDRIINLNITLEAPGGDWQVDVSINQTVCPAVSHTHNTVLVNQAKSFLHL
jgi:hypothetical protein